MRVAATQDHWDNTGSEGTTLIDWTPEDNTTLHVDAAARAFMALTVEERGEVASKITGGENEGFREA